MITLNCTTKKGKKNLLYHAEAYPYSKQPFHSFFRPCRDSHNWKLLKCAAFNALESLFGGRAVSPRSKPLNVQSTDSSTPKKFHRMLRIKSALSPALWLQALGDKPQHSWLFMERKAPQGYSFQLRISTRKLHHTSGYTVRREIYIMYKKKVASIRHLIANVTCRQQTVKSYGPTTVAAHGNAFKVSLEH